MHQVPGKLSPVLVIIAIMYTPFIHETLLTSTASSRPLTSSAPLRAPTTLASPFNLWSQTGPKISSRPN
jgi:hypothetical protein